jgi:tetratricopeptide (TPR) repeat protein
MRRAILATVLLLAALVLVYGFTVTRRERLYRQLVVQGDYALARGNTFEAVAAFTDAIDRRPDAMLAYLKRGEAHRRRGDLEAAAADLERATALDPSSPRVLELSGDVEAARERPDRAARHYAAFTKLDDRSPRVLYKLGLSHVLAGDPAAALDPLTRAIGLDARSAEAHYMLGVALRAMNRTRDAERSLRKALDLAPTLLAAREELAELYAALGRRTDRVTELERLLSADASPGRQIALAQAYADAGQAERAIRQLRLAADVYPNNAGIHLALGRVWLQRGRTQDDPAALDQSLEAFRRAVAMDTTSAARAELGKALLASDPRLAERTLRQATEQLPVDPAVFLYLAEAARRSGHAQLARQALRHYQALSGKRVP